MFSDELQHYGVLGMKWGIRKSPRTVSKGYLKKIATDNKNKMTDFSYDPSKAGKNVNDVANRFQKASKKENKALRDDFKNKLLSYEEAAKKYNKSVDPKTGFGDSNLRLDAERK